LSIRRAKKSQPEFGEIPSKKVNLEINIIGYNVILVSMKILFYYRFFFFVVKGFSYFTRKLHHSDYFAGKNYLNGEKKSN